MKKGLIPILLLSLVNVLNFAIMIPVLPFIVKDNGGGSIMYGAIISTYPIFQFFATPILGAWSDIYGRRRVLLISQAGTVLSWLIYGASYFIPSYRILGFTFPILVIMIARIVDGVTGGNNSVANAYISDITEKGERTKVFGLMGAMIGIGLVIGPGIGGYTASFSIGYLGAVITIFLISLTSLILMYFFLPETLDIKYRKHHLNFSWRDELKFITKLRVLTQVKIVKYLFFIRAFFIIVFNSYTSILVLFVIDRFALTERDIGMLFLVLGSFSIINQLGAVRIISKKLGDFQTFVLGQIFFMIALCMIFFTRSLPQFIFAAYVMNLGFSLSFPTFKSMLTSAVGPERQGEIQGVDESFVAAGSAIAPLFAGAVYGVFAGFAFPFFATILIFPLLIFVSKWRSRIEIR